jgi:hypothetical protein
VLRLGQHSRSERGSDVVRLRRTREKADIEAERARPAWNRGADCAYQGRRKWNRVETEGKRTQCRPDSAARHAIVATQHGNARQIAPITVNECRSRWLVAAVTGNRQAEGSVSTLSHGMLAMMPSGDSVNMASQCEGMPNGSVIMELDGKHMGRGRCAMESEPSPRHRGKFCRGCLRPALKYRSCSRTIGAKSRWIRSQGKWQSARAAHG